MKKIPVREITPSPNEPKISETFRIRDVKSLLGGKELVQDVHRHSFFFVLALKHGEGTHVVDFTPYPVGDNCLFVMRPGQVHQLKLSGQSSGYLLEFSKEFFHLNDRGTGSILRRATATNFCEMSERSFDKLYTILNTIFEEFRDVKEGYSEIIRAQLDIFFIEYVRNRNPIKSVQNAGTLYEQERLEDFLQQIEMHIASKKQISEYADMLNLSTYQLNAITKSVLGKTPSDLINEYIILESKRYLLATSDQVNQIAFTLGYEDPSYFIRFFKKHTGFSPDAFRASVK